MSEFVLKGKRVVLTDGESAASLLISDGNIVSIGEHNAEYDLPAKDIYDLGCSVLMPGIIDVHVHINEPGRTEWEGFETATQAAAAGGLTTLADMPLNSSPVTTTVESFRKKLNESSTKLAVDVAYHAGVVPDHAEQLNKVLSMGAIAGKAFMIDSGIDEFPFADRDTLHEAMTVLKTHNKPLLAHAELELSLDLPEPPWTRFKDYLASRPQAMETGAVKLLIELCKETGCAVHVVHLSATEPLEMLRAARAKGLPITVETSPH
ncbi:MAG: amidohydrolase family protein, partial [Chloroflexota bacterium]